MSEKKINKITVKELTERVDVNRSTFYLYYKDIFDMVEQVEAEILDNFSEAFKRYTKEAATYNNTISFFTFVFEFVQNNADMFKILLGPDGNYSFIEEFKKAIKKDHPPIDNTEEKAGSLYSLPFIISGGIGTIQQWLDDDMKISPKDMAVFVTNMISNGCNCFHNNE